MTEKITALYARYSRDDGQDTENASITNQHKLLQEYADHNGYTNCRLYFDDGYTGTNFDRPDFQRMMEDVENGLVGTIIVKDMSRFGRNYILVGQYIEFILPEHDVRVIGVSDNYDSFNTNNDMFPFENIFNEMYAADISKKVRTAKKNAGMSGIELKSHPIYGYKVRNGVYYDWEIDEEAAKIVRLIFDMYINQNYSITKIAKYLRQNKILIPGIYLGLIKVSINSPFSWTSTTVKRILEKQEYCGDVINFKTQQLSYKTNKRKYVPKDEWLIFENKHPAIISREKFILAQEKLKIAYDNSLFVDKKEKNDIYFRKKCVCSICGKLMVRKISRGQPAYICQTNAIYGECECNHIYEKELRRITFNHLKKLYKELSDNKDEFFVRLGINKRLELDSDIKFIEKEIIQIHDFQRDSYEKYYTGYISSKEFRKESKSYINQKYNLLLKSENLKRKYNEFTKKYNDIEKSIKLMEKYTDFKEVTYEMCDDLIEKVVIGTTAGHGEKNFGKRKIDIYIYGLGNLSDLIDVSFKKYSDRIIKLAPTLLAENRFHMSEVAKYLDCNESCIKNALREEKTNFETIRLKVRKEIIIDSIKKRIPPNQIYKLIGYTRESVLYWFIENYMNTTYEELCKNIDNISI